MKKDNFSDVQASIWEARKTRAITALHKDVLFKLLFLMRKGGFRNPSHALIAHLAGASRRTVWTVLQRAQTLGLLTIIHRRKKSGNRWWNDTNAYVFHALKAISAEAVASIRKFCGTGNKDIIKRVSKAVDNPPKQRHLSIPEYLALLNQWKAEELAQANCS